MKLDDIAELTIFHKIILLNKNDLFYSLLDYFTKKFKEELSSNSSKGSNSPNNTRDNNQNLIFQLEEERSTTFGDENSELTLVKLFSIKDKDGNTPLLFAAYRGNIEIISTLIDLGVKYDIKNKSGLDVIMLAAQSDNANVVVYFKEKYNYNLYQDDYQGNNSIHWASANGAKNVMTYLLYYLDDNNDMNILNKTNNNKQSALHLVILTSQNSTIIKKLIKKGIDINIKDNNGISAIDLVKNNPKNEILYKIIVDYTNSSCFGLNFHINDTKNKYFKFILFIFFFVLFFFCINYYLFPYLEQNSVNQYTISIAYYISTIIFVLSFILVLKSDPGYITNISNDTLLKMINQNKNMKRICPYCIVEQNTYTKHCFLCNKCIDIYDHHCHWVNNCVGANNKKLFIVFLCITLINLFFNMFICFEVVLTLINDNLLFKNSIISYYNFKVLVTGSVLLGNLFFCLPVGYILINQLKNDLPPVAKKKEVKEYYEDLKEINRESTLLNPLLDKEN